MNYVGEARDKTHCYSSPLEGRGTATSAINQERCNGETSDKVTIEILCPRIVIAIQIIHEQRWRGPNKHRGKDRSVAFRQAWATVPIDKSRTQICLVHLGVRHVNLL